MADKRPALGRGLSALIPSAPAPVRQDAAPARPGELDIDLLTPNPRQPRVHMDEARLEELAQSIRSHGVIQPILVRRVGDRTEIVAGERRWRAAPQRTRRRPMRTTRRRPRRRLHRIPQTAARREVAPWLRNVPRLAAD